MIHAPGSLAELFAGRIRIGENDDVRKMNFDGYLMAHRPMHRLALFQVDGCTRGKAEAVEYFAAEELALFDRGEDSARF